MRFGMLGPLEVVDGERRVPIRAGKESALLALLGLHANRAVATAQLVDDLWGDEVPDSAVKAVQVYVSHLRKALPEGRLRTHGPGYLLEVRGGELDLDRFTGLAAEGRAALGVDDARAARLLGDALALWRGPPLAGLDAPFVAVEAARLEELRLGCVEDRQEVLLALGRHQELVAELEAAAARHPLRERPRKLQMVALYRAGRQADALAVYSSFRALLDAELGIEPSPELRELERRILNQDPSLLGAAPPAPARPPNEPGQPASAGRECLRCGHVSPPGAGYCAGCGASLDEPAGPQEERKVVSVLFVDLEGFTEASDGADPEDVRDALGRYHAVARERIEAFGGTVEKFIGDAVMAVFGAPVAHGDDAERAVRAGLRVLEGVAELRSQGLALHARAAVNTGEAIVNVARRDAGEAIAIGDVVNTASRLQAAAPRGGLVVGRDTRRATRHAIGYEELPPLTAKGKAEPVPQWRATGVVGEPGERSGSPSRFVGRSRELEAIRSVWGQAVADRRPQVVTVVGPSGIGKSRLCRELSAEVEQADGRVLRGRCLPYDEQTGYQASAQLVRTALGIFENDAPALAREKLERGVVALLPLTEVGDTVRHLAALLGHDAGTRVVSQRLVFLAMRRLLECIGAERPALVVYEDIHWAAPTELELLDYLGGQLRETSVVVVVLARPELFDHRPWGAGLPAHTSIALDPLGADACRELASSLVGESAHDAVEQLVGLAEGNPLFVEELAASLADGVTGPGLPVTVTAAIAARIDALPASLRSVLFSAAVVGRTFWRDLVEALTPGVAVDEALDDLVRRDLVRREHASRLEGDVEYRFRHALIRDVAYATLPRAERAARHGDVARYVETAVGEDTEPVGWILAHHWRAAGEAERAVPYLLAAAAVAERGWATQEVVDLYTRAFDLTTDAALRRTIRLRRGMALKALDSDPEAVDELAAVLPELEGAERLDGLLYLGRAEIWCERHEEALRYGEQALEFATRLADEPGVAAASALVSNALAMRGDEDDAERAIALGDEALARWPAGSRGYERADHLHLQADIKYWTGDYAGAAELAVRAREAGGEVQSVHALLRGGGIDAMANVGLGEHETALEKLDAIITLGRELGGGGAYLPNYQSVVYRELGDLEAARRASETALDASRSMSFGMPRRFAQSDLLQTALLEGDVGRAQTEWPALWEDAAEASGWTRWLILGRLAVARAEIALNAEAPEAAAEWAAKAVEVTVRTLRRKYEVLARGHLGHALVALGRPDEGLAELRRAVATADALVNPVGRWESRASLAAALRSTGDEEAAAAATGEARQILTGFAASLTPPRAATLLASPRTRAVLDAPA
jgi:class 3 adenylate cyclase/DNA-binding SARP family transcriptional activator